MIRTKLFRQHYIITALILALFVILGVATHFLVMRLTMPAPQMNPPVFIAKFVDFVNRTGRFNDRIKALQQIERLHGKDIPPMELSIVDESGNVIHPKERALPFRWDSVPHPGKAYEHQIVDDSEGPPGPFPRNLLVRFDGAPAQYLFINARHVRPPFLGFIAPIGILVLSVLLGAGVALLALFRSLQKKAQLADSVIAELQRGNLKARFPIKRMDEVGQAMTRFNKMAEEIEKLVEQVRTAEKSRMTLLQELAHDLRTPIASLKNLMETLQGKDETIEPEVKKELLLLALNEVDYFERLVEDLLVLAQVSEPHYKTDQKPVRINELLDEEAENAAAQHGRPGQKIALVMPVPAHAVEVLGDAHLLRRMLRNALTNAFAFAKSQVHISLEQNANAEIVIRIEDDGPGISPEVLDSFGVRRQTRVLQGLKENRASIGLGSVIMRTVAEIHRGTVVPSNRTDQDDRIIGAQIKISLHGQKVS